MIGMLFRRVLFLSAICAILSFFLTGRADVSLCIVIGGAISVYKLRLFEFGLKAAGSGLSFLQGLLISLSLTFTFLILFVAIKISFDVFAGLAAGLFLVVPVIVFNAFWDLFAGKEKR